MIQVSIHQAASCPHSWLIVMFVVWSALSVVKSQYLSSPRDVKVKWYERTLIPAARPKSNKGLDWNTSKRWVLFKIYITPNEKNEHILTQWMLIISTAHNLKKKIICEYLNVSALKLDLWGQYVWKKFKGQLTSTLVFFSEESRKWSFEFK